MNTTIEVRDLTKEYGKNRAVNGLTFQVRPGVVTGFLGPNGAGKTTTMRLIMGLDHPTSGSATIGGKRYRELAKPLRQVGCLLDARAAHSGRTAYHHLLALAQSNGIPRRRVDEVLQITGLAPYGSRRVLTFSLGMNQRLGIAAALLGDPPVLMFDEPVNGLDPEGIHWIRTMLRGLAAEGRTVLVSSHLMSEMAGTADHVIVIGRGELIADTSIKDFIAGSSQGFVRVRARELEQVAILLKQAGATIEVGDQELKVTGMEMERIADLAAEHGLPLYELSPQHASLETAFMELTEGKGLR